MQTTAMNLPSVNGTESVRAENGESIDPSVAQEVLGRISSAPARSFSNELEDVPRTETKWSSIRNVVSDETKNGKKKWRTILVHKTKKQLLKASHDEILVTELEKKGTPRTAQRESKVGQELIESEKIYHHRLCILMDHFCVPICTFLKTRHTPDAAEKKAIDLVNTFFFSTISQIRDFTKELLDRLSAALNNDDPIGLVFIKYAPLLWVYYEYYEKIFIVRTSLQHFLEDSDFKELLHSLEAAPEAQDLGLDTFLQEPVQRVPRYKMLLARLLKETPLRYGVHHRSLTKAVRGVSTSLSRLNEHLKEEDMRVKIQELSREWDVSFESPNRMLIKSGLLSACSSRNGFAMIRKTKRHFLLFNDVIVQGKDRFIPALISQRWCFGLKECIVFDGTYIIDKWGTSNCATKAQSTAEIWREYSAKWATVRKSHVSPLSNYFIENGLPHDSSFVLGTPVASYHIKCGSSYEKINWVRVISEQISTHTLGRNSRFSQADQDHDGEVTLDEFKRWAKQHESMSSENAEKLFHLIDEDKNGIVGLEEFRNADIFAPAPTAAVVRSNSTSDVIAPDKTRPSRASSALETRPSNSVEF